MFVEENVLPGSDGCLYYFLYSRSLILWRHLRYSWSSRQLGTGCWKLWLSLMLFIALDEWTRSIRMTPKIGHFRIFCSECCRYLDFLRKLFHVFFSIVYCFYFEVFDICNLRQISKRTKPKQKEHLLPCVIFIGGKSGLRIGQRMLYAWHVFIHRQGWNIDMYIF